jgi:hypothetical protein
MSATYYGMLLLHCELSNPLGQCHSDFPFGALMNAVERAVDGLTTQTAANSRADAHSLLVKITGPLLHLHPHLHPHLHQPADAQRAALPGPAQDEVSPTGRAASHLLRFEERLLLLQALRAKDAISEREYADKRRDILDQM